MVTKFSRHKIAGGKYFELSTEYLEGLSQPLLCHCAAPVGYCTNLDHDITVYRGSNPQIFFVLHPVEVRNRSLKGTKPHVAITLYGHLFVYIRMHAQSLYDAISGKL